MHSIRNHTVVSVLALAAMAGTGIGSPPADSLQDMGDPLPGLVAEARKNNPELRAARLDASIAREEGRGAGALMPPQLGVEFFNAPISSFPNPLKEQMEIDYSVQQAFPFPGKRRALAKPALERAGAGEAMALALENRIVREVKEAYYSIYLAEARLRINAENQDLLRRYVEIARKQYEQGLGGQAEILMAHTELARLAGTAAELREGREEALGRLNALLDREPGTAFAAPASLATEVADLSFERVLALAERGHPDLKAGDAAVAVGEAEVAAAGKEFLPDIMVRGMYKHMLEPPLHGPQEDGWSVMVGVDLPIAPWSAPRYRGDYRAAEARLERSRLERKAAANALASGIRSALARLESAAERLELARTALVPHAGQALRSMQAAYDNGKAGFMDLLTAQRAALEAREEEQQALVRVLRGRAVLEAAAGMDYGDLAAAASRKAGEGAEP